MAKTKEKPATNSRNKGGKPRKYGPSDGQICRPLSVSVPAELIDRLELAANQVGIGRSAIVVAGLRQILAQTPDRLMEQIGG
jgi:hypothetical protein